MLKKLNKNKNYYVNLLDFYKVDDSDLKKSIKKDINSKLHDLLLFYNLSDSINILNSELNFNLNLAKKDYINFLSLTTYKTINTI